MTNQVKFFPSFSLSIQKSDGKFLTIEPPFTIEFDINRKTLSSTNTAQIRIYNLNQTNRDLLRYDFSTFSGAPRLITLRAGYGTNLTIIFTGDIKQAWSIREGVDFITTIESFDGGDAVINGALPAEGLAIVKDVDLRDVIKKMSDYLPTVSLGAIGALKNSDGTTKKLTRGNSYNGNTMANILEVASGTPVFIDNRRLFVLAENEIIENQLKVISSASGLLGTPNRQINNVTFDMLFEPSLIVGQFINLESSSAEILNSSVNGPYKVVSLKHRGIISGAVASEVITSVGFFRGSTPFVTVPLEN